jgi:hypothetical protein
MEIPFDHGTFSTRIPVLSLLNNKQVWNYSNVNGETYNSRSFMVNEPGQYTLVFYYSTAGNGGKGDIYSVIKSEKRDEDDTDTLNVTLLGQIDCYGSSGVTRVMYPITITNRSAVSVKIIANGKQLLSLGYFILGSSFMLLNNV